MSSATPESFLETCLRTACVLEASARKPGNVHPDASFADLCFADFVASAEAIAPVLARTPKNGVGTAVLQAVTRTRAAVNTNTNLGMILLLAPLAAVPLSQSIRSGIVDVLARIDLEQTRLVYEAIRVANPGGLGQVSQEDVAKPPTVPLGDAMRLGADRDLVALQYATGFEIVLGEGLEALAECGEFSRDWERAIIGLQLRLMSQHPDSLIARKCGRETAREASDRAAAVLAAGWPESSRGTEEIAAFDGWLRADAHRRNPGTTADLIAAILFAGLRERIIPLPAAV